MDHAAKNSLASGFGSGSGSGEGKASSTEIVDEATEDDDNFQVLHLHDAEEAIDEQLHHFITMHPATAKMSPDQMKDALLETMQRLEKKVGGRADIEGIDGENIGRCRNQNGYDINSVSDHLTRICKYAISAQLSLPTLMMGMYQGSWLFRTAMGGYLALKMSRKIQGFARNFGGPLGGIGYSTPPNHISFRREEFSPHQTTRENGIR